MYKMSLFFTVILFSFIIFIAGCTKEKVKLDYIETPNQMTIQSYNNKDKIQELNSKLSYMKKKGTSQEEQDKIIQEIEQLESESTLKVKDVEFIDRIMNEIVKLEGTKQGSTINVPKDKIMFLIQFPYSQNKVSNNPENIIYMNQVFIFSDGTALMVVSSILCKLQNLIYEIGDSISKNDR